MYWENSFLLVAEWAKLCSSAPHELSTSLGCDCPESTGTPTQGLLTGRTVWAKPRKVSCLWNRSSECFGMDFWLFPSILRECSHLGIFGELCSYPQSSSMSTGWDLSSLDNSPWAIWGGWISFHLTGALCPESFRSVDTANIWCNRRNLGEMFKNERWQQSLLYKSVLYNLY